MSDVRVHPFLPSRLVEFDSHPQLSRNSINNPTWVRPSDGKEIPMIFPPAGLEYREIDSKGRPGRVRTLENYRPELVVLGMLASTINDRCNRSKYENAVKEAAKQAAKGKPSSRTKAVWFPDHHLEMKRNMVVVKQRKIHHVNNTNLVECQFVLGQKGPMYYD